MKLEPIAKPVRIRIKSNGKECSNLKELKENFSYEDLLLLLDDECMPDDNRLFRWLNQIGEEKIASDVKDFISKRLHSEEHQLNNCVEFISIFFDGISTKAEPNELAKYFFVKSKNGDGRNNRFHIPLEILIRLLLDLKEGEAVGYAKMLNYNSDVPPIVDDVTLIKQLLEEGYSKLVETLFGQYRDAFIKALSVIQNETLQEIISYLIKKNSYEKLMSFAKYYGTIFDSCPSCVTDIEVYFKKECENGNHPVEKDIRTVYELCGECALSGSLNSILSQSNVASVSDIGDSNKLKITTAEMREIDIVVSKWPTQVVKGNIIQLYKMNRDDARKFFRDFYAETTSCGKALKSKAARDALEIIKAIAHYAEFDRFDDKPTDSVFQDLFVFAEIINGQRKKTSLSSYEMDKYAYYSYKQETRSLVSWYHFYKDDGKDHWIMDPKWIRELLQLIDSKYVGSLVKDLFNNNFNDLSSRDVCITYIIPTLFECLKQYSGNVS